MEKRVRVFGIDWLEMFVSESPRVDYSPEGFEARGWWVKRREYGTMTMEQMFTLEDRRGYPFIEVRRLPRGLRKDGTKTVYMEGDSYVRLCNMYCYDENPIDLMCRFLSREHYTIKKIYRIDVYLDFVRFDSGDIPQRVARRILTHVYSKVNQTDRATRGKDTWTECKENWLSWGATGSMVSTKFYNKTKELRDAGMTKLYIVENWKKANLIPDVVDVATDEKAPEVWRLEFSIKGNAKGWIYIDKKDSEDGERHWLPHSPAVYADKKGVLNAIANLIPYYFKFRIYREGVRKSNCKEKVLFRFSEDEAEQGYRLTNVSDMFRVRHQETESDVIALNHLVKAATKLSGTEFSPRLASLINDVGDRVREKSRRQYDTQTDVF